jgi:hypothetical protein
MEQRTTKASGSAPSVETVPEAAAADIVLAVGASGRRRTVTAEETT